MNLIRERCTGCAYCVLVCPHHAIVTDGWASVVDERCTDCNLCYHACPNDCFLPDVPLKPHRPDIAAGYDVAVVGAGIGGLMAAAALAQSGRRVAVFEKLSFPGGRYTGLDYRGTSVTTAAWTSLGPECHIGHFLADLGVKESDSDDSDGLRYISLRDAGLSGQYSVRFPDGRQYPSLMGMLSPAAGRAWLRAIARGRREAPDDVSAHDYVTSFSDDPDLLAVVDAMAATASSLSSRAMPASEYIQITLDSREAGPDFAMVAGGVVNIIKVLTSALKMAGGHLFLRTPVTRIQVADRRVTGVGLARERTVSADIVVHNGGPARLYSWWASTICRPPT